MIVIFLRTVSGFMVHVDLRMLIKLTRAGLKAIYSTCHLDYQVRGREKVRSFLKLFLGLRHVKASKSHMFGAKDFLLDGMLQGIVKIFTGAAHRLEFDQRSQDIPKPQCTTLISNSICVCLDALHNLSINPAPLGTIHVTSGQIKYNERNCCSVWGFSPASKELSGF